MLTISIDTNKYKCNNIFINNRSRGINTMRNIYVIIHHYFDEDNQKDVAKLYSEWDFYCEALDKVEVIRKLSKYDGWFEIKQVTTYSDRIYGW